MSQPTVTSFFNTRKRQATDDLRNKSKVLILDQGASNEVSKSSTEPSDPSTSPKLLYPTTKSSKKNSAVRNIQFDAKTSPRTPRMITRARATRGQRASVEEGQQDIRESFKGSKNEGKSMKNVPFEKKGLLSPRKPVTPKKNDAERDQDEEVPAAGSITPKRTTMERLGRPELSLRDIKDKINRSSRLAELKASIDRIKMCEQKLESIRKSDGDKDEVMPPKIRKFDKIEVEVPISPQKPCSPMKTPTKSRRFVPGVSPQRRLLFEPKEKTPSPVKSSPTKAPAYQRYQSIVDTGTLALPLPFNYRFIGEVFRCVDTVAAMLFNRKETITFRKLKPAVQELLRRNFTVEHLAQVQTIFPEGYTLSQEKMRSFGSASKGDKYELVLVPKVEGKSGRNTPDDDDVLKSAAEMSMAPGVLLERRRKFYQALLGMIGCFFYVFWEYLRIGGG